MGYLELGVLTVAALGILGFALLQKGLRPGERRGLTV